MGVSICTRPHYRMLSEITESRGARVSELATACGSSKTHARKIINDLIKADLVHRVGGLHYVSDGGVVYLATHSGTTPRDMKGLLTLAPKPRSTIGTARAKRRKAISEIRARFREEGFDVFDGRRMGMGRPTGKQQWHPDLWVPIPGGARRSVWHAVVVDPSTQADGVIREFLRSYWYSARRDRDDRALLVVCRDDAAAQLFDEIGDDLNMMVATYRDCLRGQFSGSESVWKSLAGIKDIDFLAKQMMPN